MNDYTITDACFNFLAKFEKAKEDETKVHVEKTGLLSALRANAKHSAKDCGANKAHCGICNNFIDVQSTDLAQFIDEGSSTIKVTHGDRTYKHKLDSGRIKAFKKCIDQAKGILSEAFKIMSEGETVGDFVLGFNNETTPMDKKIASDKYLRSIATSLRDGLTVEKVCFVLSVMTYATAETDPDSNKTGERDLDMELTNCFSSWLVSEAWFVTTDNIQASHVK